MIKKLQKVLFIVALVIVSVFGFAQTTQNVYAKEGELIQVTGDANVGFPKNCTEAIHWRNEAKSHKNNSYHILVTSSAGTDRDETLTASQFQAEMQGYINRNGCEVTCTPFMNYTVIGSAHRDDGTDHEISHIKHNGESMFCLDPNIIMTIRNNCTENYKPEEWIQTINGYDLKQIGKILAAYETTDKSDYWYIQAQQMIWNHGGTGWYSGNDTSALENIMNSLDNAHYKVHKVNFDVTKNYKLGDVFTLNNLGNGDFASDKYSVGSTSGGITVVKDGNATKNTITQPYPLSKNVNINSAGKGDVQYLNDNAKVKYYPAKLGADGTPLAQNFAWFGQYINNTFQEEWTAKGYKINMATGNIHFVKKDSFDTQVSSNYCSTTHLCVLDSADATNNTFRLLIDDTSAYWNTNADTQEVVTVDGKTYHVFQLENGTKSWKTNSNGEFTISNVLVGDYYLQETSVDENVFILNTDLVKVTVNEGKTTESSMKNINLFGDFELQKYDEFGNKGLNNTHNTNASGNSFKLKYVDTLGKDVFTGKTFNLPDGVVAVTEDKYLEVNGSQLFTTDDNGYFHIGESFPTTNNLCVPFGNWVLEEVAVQNEFELNTTTQNIEIEVGQKAHSDFTNNYREIKLKLQKQDKNNVEMVEGAKYYLYDVDKFNIGNTAFGQGNLYPTLTPELFASTNISASHNLYDEYLSKLGYDGYNYVYELDAYGTDDEDKFVSITNEGELINGLSSGKTLIKVSTQTQDLFGKGTQNRFFYIGNHSFDPEAVEFYFDSEGTRPVNVRSLEFTIVNEAGDSFSNVNEIWDTEGHYKFHYTVIDEARHKWEFDREVTYRDDHEHICEYNAVLNQFVWGDTKEICKNIEQENPSVKQSEEEYDPINHTSRYDAEKIIQHATGEETPTYVGEFDFYSFDKTAKPDLNIINDIHSLYKIGEYTTDKNGEALIEGLKHSRDYMVCEHELPQDYTYDNSENVCFVVKGNYDSGVITKTNTKNNDLTVSKLKTTAIFTDDVKELEFSTDPLTTDVKVYDKVKYMGMNDYYNQSMTMKGSLIEKSTGNVIATAEVPFTVKGNYGFVDVEFTFTPENRTEEYVVFEEVYNSDNELLIFHKDLLDAEQTVKVIGKPAITSVLLDVDDNNHEVITANNIKLQDTVNFVNLDTAKTYTVISQLVKKSDGSVVTTVNSEFTPTAVNGSFTVDFENIDTTALAGESLVAYETIKLGDEVIVEHKDINDLDQTVTVFNPSYSTEVSNHDIHISEHNTTVDFNDVVTYKNLELGKNIVIKAWIVDSEGEPVIINGNKLTSQATFVTETHDGTVNLHFRFNAAISKLEWLNDGNYTIYSELYIEDTKELEDKDVNNEHETFKFTDDYRYDRFKKKEVNYPESDKRKNPNTSVEFVIVK